MNNLPKPTATTRNKSKKVPEQPLPARRTRNVEVKHQNRLPVLQLFGRLCRMKLPSDGWLPYLIADDEFHFKECRAHMGKMECKDLLSMNQLGVNSIEVYAAVLLL